MARIFVNFGIFCVVTLGLNYVRAAPELSFADRVSTGVKLGVEKGIDIVKNAPQFIPTPKQLGDMSKEALFGLPSSVLLDGINAFCSLALATDNNLSRDAKDKPDYRNLSMILYDDKENASFALTEMDKLVQHPSFNKNAPVVILVTGWLSNAENATNDAAQAIYSAYRCRGDTNFLLVDTSEYVATLYTWSALNTEDLGQILAPAVAALTKHVNIGQFHLIGHSLGAHIVGATGRNFQDVTNNSLPRITGLDPARPCFNQGEALSGLGRGDADLVDIIHSNSDGLGKKEPIGDVDFYPNGVKVLMPGCFDISCAHGRAWEYYSESVLPGNENAFLATRCNSLTSLTQKKCNYRPIPMGYATPSTAKGNYFLETESKPPYSKNSQKNTTCRSSQ